MNKKFTLAQFKDWLNTLPLNMTFDNFSSHNCMGHAFLKYKKVPPSKSLLENFTGHTLNDIEDNTGRWFFNLFYELPLHPNVSEVLNKIKELNLK